VKRKTKKWTAIKHKKGLMLWSGMAVVGVTLSAGSLRAGEDAASTETDPPTAASVDEEVEGEEETPELTPWMGGSQEYSGWVNFNMGGAMVTGNEAEFQRRTGINSGVFGGASEFAWEQFVGESGLFKTSGTILGGLHDYDIKLSYDHTDVGYIKFGASEHRSWYDGTGGYDPSTGAWFPLANQDLSLDRSSIWIEGGLNLPDWPELKVRYEHRTREGQKDSTIWGTTSPIYGGTAIAATLQGINETQDIVEADIKHDFGKTEAAVGLTYEHSDIDNSLDFRRNAGGLTQTYTTQKTGVDSDLFNVHAHTDTRLHEKVSFAVGYSYTSLDTDVSGSRIGGLAPDPVYDPALARYPGFLNLGGGSQLQQQVASVNVPYRPTKNLAIVPSVIFESVGRESSTFYTATPIGNTSLRNVNSEEDSTDIGGRLEIRYTGITNIVLYARGNWDQADSDLDESQIATATGALDMARATDLSRFTQQYTAGVNWYPKRRLNTALQYYYKSRDNDYDHILDSTDNGGTIRYPAYLTSQDFDTQDVNFRVTWRPMGNLVSVTRVDFQWSTIDTAGGGNPAIQSGDIQSQIYSQNLTWSPLTSLFLNGNFSYVISSTKTPADQSAPFGVVLQSNNNYWNAGLAAGYSLDSKTDLTAEYQYYEADNYQDNSTVSQPYGSGFQEHRITASIKRRIKENIRLVLGYGYYSNNDITYGGYQDYTANVVYSTLQWRF
jgi:hypothetical protein